MAHLAMNMAGFVNGVSKLHGKVSKKMWMDDLLIFHLMKSQLTYYKRCTYTFTLIERYAGIIVPLPR